MTLDQENIGASQCEVYFFSWRKLQYFLAYIRRGQNMDSILVVITFKVHCSKMSCLQAVYFKTYDQFRIDTCLKVKNFMSTSTKLGVPWNSQVFIRFHSNILTILNRYKKHALKNQDLKVKLLTRCPQGIQNYPGLTNFEPKFPDMDSSENFKYLFEKSLLVHRS